MIPRPVRLTLRVALSLSNVRLRWGQMLVELLIAIGVASLAVVALVGVTTRSISNASFSKNKSATTAFANQAMEWIRSQKNADWQTFVTRAGQTYCINDLIWPVQAGSCPAKALAGIFSREVKLTVINATPPQLVEAAVTVNWSEAKRDFTSRQTTVFTGYFVSIPPPSRQLISAVSFNSGYTESNVGCCGWVAGCGAHYEDELCNSTASYAFASPNGARSFRVDLNGELGLRHGAGDAHTDWQRLCVDSTCFTRNKYLCGADGACCSFKVFDTWGYGTTDYFTTEPGLNHTVSFLVQGGCSDWGESTRASVFGTIYFYDQ